MRAHRFGVIAMSSVLVAGVLGVSASTALGANPEGMLDSTFDGDGTVTRLVRANNFATDSAVQPDGRLVVVGGANDGIRNYATLLRYATNGTLDTSFGGDGIVETLVGTNDSAEAVALQSDGRIVAILRGNVAGESVSFIARYTTAGALDPTFSADGIVSIAPAGGPVGLQDLTIDAEGRIVIVGEQGNDAGTDGGVFVGRLTGAGGWDATFNGTGYRLIKTADPWSAAIGVAADELGRVTYVGDTYPSGGGSRALVGRLTATGAPDTTFHGTGRFDDVFGGADHYLTDMLLAPDGAAILAGSNAGSALVARLTTGGQLDAGFATGGVGRYRPGTVSSGESVVALEPNGKIVLAARGGSDLWVARVFPNGTIDPTFGSAGYAGADIGTAYDTPVGIGITSNGKLTIGVRPQNSGANPFAAVRMIGDATSPFGARATNVPRVATSRTLTIAWSASDDNTGVASFDVRQRSASYSSSTLGTAVTWKSRTTGASAAFTGSTGRTYCLDVRAYDRAGNRGLFGAPACVAIPVDDRSLTRSGSWTSVSSSGYYLGTGSRSTASGATLRLTGVKYRRLSLLATTCSTCGTARVYLGSTQLKSINLASSTTKRAQVFTIDVSSALKGGTVTIRQSSGGKQVIIEGLAVGLY